MEFLSHITLTEVPVGTVLYLLGVLTGGVFVWTVGRFFASSKA